jgi:hypothetical protein
MSTDEYENANVRFLNDFSSVNISDPEWYRERPFRHLQLVNLENFVKCV